MAEFLFVTPAEMTAKSILGGNVDIDKYKYAIASVQLSIIEPLLGTELYDKIASEAEAVTLAGDYATLYTEYVQPITLNAAVAEYIEVSNYMLDNGGLFKHAPDNSEIVDKDEAQSLAQKYSAFAQMYVQRFEKWICKNPLTEYKLSQDDVNASKNISLTGGLWFGGPSGLTEDELGFDKRHR